MFGVYNYFRYVIYINLDLNRMNYVFLFIMYNWLLNCSIRCYFNKVFFIYKKFYLIMMKMYKVVGVYLYFFCDVFIKIIYGFNMEDILFILFGC